MEIGLIFLHLLWVPFIDKSHVSSHVSFSLSPPSLQSVEWPHIDPQTPFLSPSLTHTRSEAAHLFLLFLFAFACWKILSLLSWLLFLFLSLNVGFLYVFSSFLLSFIMASPLFPWFFFFTLFYLFFAFNASGWGCWILNEKWAVLCWWWNDLWFMCWVLKLRFCSSYWLG